MSKRTRRAAVTRIKQEARKKEKATIPAPALPQLASPSPPPSNSPPPAKRRSKLRRVLLGIPLLTLIGYAISSVALRPQIGVPTPTVTGIQIFGTQFWISNQGIVDVQDFRPACYVNELVLTGMKPIRDNAVRDALPTPAPSLEQHHGRGFFCSAFHVPDMPEKADIIIAVRYRFLLWPYRDLFRFKGRPREGQWVWQEVNDIDPALHKAVDDALDHCKTNVTLGLPSGSLAPPL